MTEILKRRCAPLVALMSQESFNAEDQKQNHSLCLHAISLHGDFALSVNGTVLVTRPRFESDARLTWINRNGTPMGTLGPPGVYEQPVIGPDGNRVLFNKPDDNGGNRDVWSIEISRGIASRLTLTGANEWSNVWAPDGRSIIFASDRSGNRVGSTFEKSSMEPGSGETAVANLPDFANPDDWSSDGRWTPKGARRRNSSKKFKRNIKWSCGSSGVSAGMSATMRLPSNAGS